MVTRRVFLGIALAMSALVMVGCGGKEESAAPVETVAPVPNEAGYVDVKTPSDELNDIAYSQRSTLYSGVGTGESTSENMARDVSATNARSELALSITTEIKTKSNDSQMNDKDKQAVETRMAYIVEEATKSISGISIQKTITKFNPTERKYMVYTLVSASRDEVNRAIQQQASNDEMLKDVAGTTVFTNNIMNTVGE
jgi:hypothetical protein